MWPRGESWLWELSKSSSVFLALEGSGTPDELVLEDGLYRPPAPAEEEATLRDRLAQSSAKAEE